ncbi:membrane protein insertion efficiency factor YidD [Gracilibacillus boraciitolerans]|uniref:membrane protein insertion efficiency factor YidD n=1 Tax=Gracilibacillus boraciitolerans TaxID=307521 RepID=UPI0009FC495A|nr:membrane protein insertion efficiency factor YidD [Gracilibacillus boraciitolerans]
MRTIFILFIRFYRYFISPMFPPSCRFQPTCSQYSLECYQRFNVFKATYLSIKRILKCHPFHPGGFDPVPDKKMKL